MCMRHITLLQPMYCIYWITVIVLSLLAQCPFTFLCVLLRFREKFPLHVVLWLFYTTLCNIHCTKVMEIVLYWLELESSLHHCLQYSPKTLSVDVQSCVTASSIHGTQGAPKWHNRKAFALSSRDWCCHSHLWPGAQKSKISHALRDLWVAYSLFPVNPKWHYNSQSISELRHTEVSG